MIPISSTPLAPLRFAALVLLALGLAAGRAGAQAPGSVRGEVRSEQGAAPLAAAVVELLGVGAPRRVATDSAGRYLLAGVPAGRQLIRARFVGHAPLEVEVVVPAGGEVRLDLALRVAPVALDPVRVEAGRAARGGVDTATAASAELGIAGARVLGMSPGLSELGLAEVAQGPPGQEPPDPSDVLYVRGAAADLKLVYLDGAPVYAPFPLGGLQEAFAPRLLRSAEVYLGGAPARYDGGLSYVMDLRTRGVRADAPHSEGALDLLTGRALLEAPLGRRAGLLLSGRTVHGLGAVEPLPYQYAEGLARFDLELGREGVLRLTGFRNDEEVWLEGEDSAVAWGNAALSAQFRGTLLGENAELTASVGSFQAELPVSGTRPVLAEGATHRARLAADFSRQAGELRLRYGLSFDRLQQRYRARTWAEATEGEPGIWTYAQGDALGAYGDAAWQPARRVSLRAGLRADRYSLEEQWVLAPRAAATWLVSESAALTLAAGRYHQYVRAPEDALLDSSMYPGRRAAAEPLVLGSATHLALGLDQQLGEGIRFGVEGYFKEYQGMPAADASAANASGVDVWVRRGEGAWTGWMGYSLAWIWSVPEGSDSNRFAGRHLLSAGLDVPLGERSMVDLRFAYGAGLPYSAIPLTLANNDTQLGTTAGTRSAATVEQLNGGADAAPLLPSPDQPYVRLDLSASRTWSRRWLGTSLEVASYLKLLNTLGTRDALFYRFDRDQDDRPRGIAVLPVVPVVGMEWKF